MICCDSDDMVHMIYWNKWTLNTRRELQNYSVSNGAKGTMIVFLPKIKLIPDVLIYCLFATLPLGNYLCIEIRED